MCDKHNNIYYDTRIIIAKFSSNVDCDIHGTSPVERGTGECFLCAKERLEALHGPRCKECSIQTEFIRRYVWHNEKVYTSQAKSARK